MDFLSISSRNVVFWKSFMFEKLVLISPPSLRAVSYLTCCFVWTDEERKELAQITDDIRCSWSLIVVPRHSFLSLKETWNHLKDDIKWFPIKLKAFNGQCEEMSKITFIFRMLLYGVKQFNLQPERGLKYLQENGFLENNPDSVAKFLFRQERLSKKQIGEWAESLSNVDIESNSWHWWHWTNFFTRCRQVSWKPLGIQQRSPASLCPMPWIYPTFIGPSLEAVLVEFQVCNWS